MGIRFEHSFLQTKIAVCKREEYNYASPRVTSRECISFHAWMYFFSRVNVYDNARDRWMTTTIKSHSADCLRSAEVKGLASMPEVLSSSLELTFFFYTSIFFYQLYFFRLQNVIVNLLKPYLPPSLGSVLSLLSIYSSIFYGQGWALLYIYSSIFRVRAGPYCAYIPVSLGSGTGICWVKAR
jgi:hypothetical protein